MISVRRLANLCLPLLVLGSAVVWRSTELQAQQAAPRKLLERTAPIYPVLARSMGLEGTVKVEALVAADGTVKSVFVKGGHPVLAQAAVNTVRRWRWEPAAHETHEIVELKFSPAD
jgi:TonB family protein